MADTPLTANGSAEDLLPGRGARRRTVQVYRPQQAAQRLGIAPSTLRLWSHHFAKELGDAARRVTARGSGIAAQRRYSDDDLRTLIHVKSLLSQGLTYEDVKRRMGGDPLPVARFLPAASRTPKVGVSDEPPTFPQEAQASLEALRAALTAKDKTIAALKESLEFLEAYLNAIRSERNDSRERVRRMERELVELRSRTQEQYVKTPQPWWKRII